MKLGKRFLTAGLLAASVLGAASCGGSGNQLEIFLYQENVAYNANMEVFKQANAYAGVELKGVIQQYDSSYETLFNTKGKKANLVVNDQDTIEATALSEGIFVDLTPLIEAHAPNLKAYFEANPEHKAWATAQDGKIYGIPFYTDGKTAKAFFVRQDWVNILTSNNKLPEGINKDNLNALTVVQFEELLTAFKKNEKLLMGDSYFAQFGEIYPYIDKDDDFAISELASLWNATGDLYVENGVVKHGAIESEFKQAMIELRRWYKNGLIEPDIFNNSNNSDKRVDYFASNQGGATHDWIGTTYSFNDEVYAANLPENFQLTCILPPERADGSRYEPTVRKQIGKVTAINSKTSEEDQIKLIKWIDYFFTEAGHDSLNFGIEGTHFTKENGVYKYTDKIINDNATALANLYAIGAQMQGPGVQTFDYEEAWLSTEAAKAMKDYEQYLNPTYNDLIYPNIKFSNEDYKSVNAARNTVSNVYDQQVYDWLTGKEEINDTTWNNFVKNMKDAGVETIISITQKYVDAKKN